MGSRVDSPPIESNKQLRKEKKAKREDGEVRWCVKVKRRERERDGKQERKLEKDKKRGKAKGKRKRKRKECKPPPV